MKGSLFPAFDLATLIGKQAPNSTFVQSHPSLQAACNAVVAVGAELAASEATVKSAEAALAAARSARDAKVDVYDAAHAVCVAQTEQLAKTPEDIQSVGFDVFGRASHGLAVPVGIQVRFDAANNVIRVDVERAPGMTACVIELSTDPIAPATWQRLPGNGARRKLAGYAPGTYWLRAASVRASEQSDFTSAVAVTVR